MQLGKNELSVIQQGERFIVSLQMGTATPMEEVKKYIQHAPMAESKALLEKIVTQEDDIACDEVEVSLRSSPDSSNACLGRRLCASRAWNSELRSCQKSGEST
jgi:hypothetical protein